MEFDHESQKPELTPESIQSRLSHAEQGIDRQPEVYEKTIYVDEFSIDTRKSRQKIVKRRVNERYADKNINKYRLKSPKTLSFVICFCSKALGPVALIDGRFTVEKYLSYLHHQMLPFARRVYGDDFFVLQDNAPIHRASIVADYLASHLPDRVISHPPYSPDLNPVEHIGNLIKKKFFEFFNVPNSTMRHFNTSQEIWTLILRICYSIDEDKIKLKSLAASMHSRFCDVIDADGLYTKY